MKKKLQIAHAIGCFLAVIFIGMGVHAIFGSGLLAWITGAIGVVSIGLLFRNLLPIPRETKPEDELNSVTTT